ncbi:catechol 2,3-dioxygenase-like lactoylglutathione lyase family enzyme [Novosphingobium chloroacetimidivorans]|uniref:Catechol 2,3-dioxygenase-like lactoylglutathione lyase family enzyme n=1 Tax=Novosphingobium chloroacetimidivorans TaxID=1428314 RepID=A0A7W7K8Y9_9SPHN|nr:glyoxalase [Novosphingobium chloroacetimidivorans]MBB4858447.1 catechol 2,3-dioxygenase-like lactoylglutathione lyase family enzyme [Novosphingobium chloroacetimidivorans]
MTAMPVAHISWALADNAERPACDAFFQDVFGARTVFEMLETPETAGMGLDREERLMLVGETMIIPIAPAGEGVKQTSPLGNMLRRSAAPMRWIGVALKVASLAQADARLRAARFDLHYDPGMENHYFIVARHQALGMRIEVLAQDLPNDPRRDPEWRADPADNPLGIEGLQAIGLSAPSVGEARAIFGTRFGWPELGERAMIEGAAFDMGDTVLEVLTGSEGSAVATHAREIKGIYHLVFKVRDARAAAAKLRERGLDLIGDVSDRFAIAPEQAHGRLIWLTDVTPEGYPPVGSRMHEFAPA